MTGEFLKITSPKLRFLIIPLVFMIGQKQKCFSNSNKIAKLYGLKKKSLDGCYDETCRLIITVNSTS